MLLSTNRHQQILDFVRDHKQATVAQLSQLVDVSETTIRRDLDKLQSMGQVSRVHGGAIALKRADPEPPALQRMDENAEAKKGIGIAAASLIQNGETIFLGSGTTTLQVAASLPDDGSLTVVTNSLTILNALAGRPNVTLIVLGGLFRYSELSMIGHITERAMEELRADKVIMGIRAINPQDGLTNDSLSEAMTDRAIVNLGRQVIVVADHTKFGRVSTVLVAPISAVDVIVTDSQAPADQLETIRSAGVEVIIADQNPL
jgi:DeoR family transcriptional regulator of aga operon